MVAWRRDTSACRRSCRPVEKDDPTIWRVDDALWALLEPILKSEKPRTKAGRPRRGDRAILDELIWLARAGSRSSQLPREFGPTSTVHERFSERGTGTGVGGSAAGARRGDRAELVLAGRRWVHRQGPVRQKGGLCEAQATGRNPTGRGEAGTKRRLLTEAGGLPVALVATGASRHDMTQLAAVLDGTVIEPTPTDPPHLALDRGYDYAGCRDVATARGDTSHVLPEASEASPLPPPGHPDRHPPRRREVEVAHSWFNRFRRLLTRTEKQAATPSASATSPPSSSSTARSAMPDYFPDSMLVVSHA
jgi:transposase